MRAWLVRAGAVADDVSRRPELWLPGALGWLVTVGWLVLVVGVAHPPSVSELTFAGATIFTSGAWPWNAIAIAGTAVAVLVAASALFSVAEAFLVGRWPVTRARLVRRFVLTVVCVLPALIALLGLATAAFAIAPVEFNAPGRDGDPVLRTLVRLTPLVFAVAIAAVAGSAIHAAASRDDDMAVADAIRSAPRHLARAGAPAVIQAATALIGRLAFGALAAALLRVLWAPIAERLAVDGMDAAVMLLLVGFVAIWLCLVLAGGALHAWGSLTWTRVLGTARSDALGSRHGMEPRGRT
jgi:hypothetical protein